VTRIRVRSECRDGTGDAGVSRCLRHSSMDFGSVGSRRLTAKSVVITNTVTHADTFTRADVPVVPVQGTWCRATRPRLLAPGDTLTVYR